MKTVLFMRHGLTLSYSNDGLDHSRKLTSFGISEVEIVAEKVNNLNFSPEFIITSDAQRAKKTAQIMQNSFKHKPQLQLSKFLYLADSDTIFNQLLSINNEQNTILLISHNPGLSVLVNKLGYQTKSLLEAQIAIFQFHISDWCDLYTVKPQFITSLHSSNSAI